MLLALSTGQKLGLLAVAGVFIAFAVASAFYFPRRNPDFPGDRLGSFVALALLLFVGTISAVVFVAREDEAGGGGREAIATNTLDENEEGPAADTTTTAPPTTGETTGGGTTTDAGKGGGSSGEARGDAAAGKQVFATAGCAGCHTLSDAGASGNVGPNLDDAKPSYELAVERVTNGKAPMPSFKDQLDEKQIRDVATYVVEATAGS